MKIWGIGQISETEKNDILDKHRSLYNGYKTMQPKVSNTQPLYTQDFANDKNGVVVNNRGEVKQYTNMGINEQAVPKFESVDMELDESNVCECGGMMREGECMECGWKMEATEETQQEENLDNVSDLNMNSSFDYVDGATNKTDSFDIEAHEASALDADAMQNVTGQEAPHDADDMAPDGMDDDSDNDRAMMNDGEMEEQGGNADDMDVSDVESAYNFVSGGPMGGGSFANYSDDSDENPDEIDEDSFTDLIKADNELEDEREELEEDPQFEKMESAWSEEEELDEQGWATVARIAAPIAINYAIDKLSNEGEEDEDGYEENELEVDFDEFDPRDKSWEEIKAHTDNWDEIDEDLKESFQNQKNRIMEMMVRMKTF